MPNVLVVDDDVKLLEAVRARLESLGYNVVVAQDAYFALATAVRDHPDLLLLDVNLPAGNGFGVEKRLHKIPGMDHIPVIYMTGESPESIEQYISADGGQRVLFKPFNSADLMCAVQDTLDGVLIPND